MKNSRELAVMLKQLPREERLRIEGAIIWASMAQRQVGPAQRMTVPGGAERG